MRNIRVFTPATIANLSCGFDVLGLALDGIGDYMDVELTGEPGVVIGPVTGGDIPLDANDNVAGITALAMLDASEYTGGVRIGIDKRIKPGSGIGSSAASSAGAAWAFNKLLGEPFSLLELVGFAMKGEERASGAAHADNVAPALFGGITLVRSYSPLDIARVHCPADLHACILHPQIEIKTSDARKVLKTSIPLSLGIRQWGNVGGLVTGLFTEDYGLISRSLEDFVIEPVRSLLIPGFGEMRRAAMEAGALGFGISGSGPSVFALCRGPEVSRVVADALHLAYAPYEIPYDIHLSAVNQRGIYIAEPEPK